MSYEIDYLGGERFGCSSKIVIADRIFYVKLFGPWIKIFLRDQQGVIQKKFQKPNLNFD
jgi:hypothetical protein